MAGQVCHLCRQITKNEMVNIPVVLKDKTATTVPVHTFCAYRFVSNQRSIDVRKLNGVISAQHERICRVEKQLSRVIDSDRFKAAATLLKLSL